jgi:transcriptional regulator with XRE-family HTH domain
MEIGNKISELRKKNNLSQEELADKVGVARQTISKWELCETSPDLKQAKELSKIFNISIDELTDNDIKNILEEKVSNTEKLAGIAIKILKVIGILFIVFLVIDIISLIIFSVVRKPSIFNNEKIELTCHSANNDYVITVGTDEYFNCSNCSSKIQNDLKNKEIDFDDIELTKNNIIKYFEDNDGFCK